MSFIKQDQLNTLKQSLKDKDNFSQEVSTIESFY